MGPEKTVVKSCERCIRKAVCILYHGYTKMELQYGPVTPLNPEEVMARIGEALAMKCGFYIEAEDSK